jgi:hypothetical protein
MGNKNTCRFWWGNLRGKRPAGRPTGVWENTVEMNLNDIRKGEDQIHLMQDMDMWRLLVNMVMSLRDPKNAEMS